MRAVSYLTSALRFARDNPEIDQVQFISTDVIGCQVSRLKTDRVNEQSQLLQKVGQLFVATIYPDVQEKVAFLQVNKSIFDAIDECEPAVKAIRDDRELHHKLSEMARKNYSRYESYVAGHVVLHDTAAAELLEPAVDSISAIETLSVISFGAKSERIFHQARMKVREDVSLERVKVAQFITRHTLPPYFVAKDGEPLLSEALQEGFSVRKVTDLSAMKDIKHFMQNEVGVKQ